MTVITKEDYDEMQKQLAEKVPTDKVGRPSPRTQGVTAEGETFQKFGTQQLEFVAPVVYGTPYQGIVQKDVGKSFKAGSQEWFKGFVTSAPQPFGAPTVFSQRIIAGITGATPVGASYVPPPATPNGELDCPHCKHGCECENCKKGIGECSDKRAECNAWDLGCEWFGLPNGNGKSTPICTKCDSAFCKECDAGALGNLLPTNCDLWHMTTGSCTPPVKPPTPTCECEACKTGTGECSTKRPCCNAWDFLCEMGGECSKPKPPEECAFFDIGCKVRKWWEQYGTVVMIIGGLIGLGILLWLLRPLFGIAKNITET